MNVKNLTLEQMVSRWEDRREIQNIMGRYTYDLMLKREKDIFETFWSKYAPQPCLSFNDGRYIGQDAVKSYYEALHQKNILRTSLIMSDFADKTGDMTAEELYGAGVLNHKPLGNQIIEIAEDGQTAKAFWYVVGKEDEYGEYGPLSYWTFGMYGVDFVWEEGQWRIWHLIYVEDVHTPCGESWASSPKHRESNAHYQPIANFKMPDYTQEIQLHMLYTPERPFTKTIALPEEYSTFAETFSYGA